MAKHRESTGATFLETLLSSDDPAERTLAATTLLERSRDLEVLREALSLLEHAQDPSFRQVLHAKHNWCEESPSKRDSSGFIRADIIRALHPIVHPDDEALLRRALTTYQMQGTYELCAELRTVALRVMNDLDPELAAMFAARFLTDPLTSFSGEPAMTAIRVLAAQQRLEPVFALASWSQGNAQVVGEALRNLTKLRTELIPLLIDAHLDTEANEITLGLFDLLLGHHDRCQWHETVLDYIKETADMDMYGIIVTTLVASRDEYLISELKDQLEHEHQTTRSELLGHALNHA